MYKVAVNWTWDQPSHRTIMNEARQWCIQQFGKSRYPGTKKYKWLERCTWNEYKYSYLTNFYFDKEEHATWFKLRWA